MEDPDQLRDGIERAALATLALSVQELVAIVGKLNAITGAATETFLSEHEQIREELFDLMASVVRVGDHFAPPAPPEQL